MFNMNYRNILILQFMKMDNAFHHRNEHEYEAAKEWICEEYVKLEKQLAEMKATVNELQNENEQLKKAEGQKRRSNADRGYDDAAMYADYLKTGSLTKTGKNFGCHRDTVKDHLVRAGYIEDKPMNQYRRRI